MPTDFDPEIIRRIQFSIQTCGCENGRLNLNLSIENGEEQAKSDQGQMCVATDMPCQ